MDVYRCSTHWFRLDREGSMQQTNPFAHADQPQAFALHDRIDVESDACVADLEMNFSCVLHHLHFDTSCLAVFDGVMQSFL